MKKPPIRRLCAVAIGTVLVLVGLPVLGLVAWDRLRVTRKDWKEQAIPEIIRFADDPERVAQEIAFLGAAEPGSPQRIIAQPWLTDWMILMANGEWLVYKNHCNKRPPHNVRDIFLAKGSDGKWYYSTCHFCVGMIALVSIQDAQPSDLATFARLYNLSEFDGKSDKCLQETKTFPDFDEVGKANKAAAR